MARYYTETITVSIAYDAGFVDKGISVARYIYKSFDTDDVHSAVDENTIIMHLEKLKKSGDFMLTKMAKS